MEKEEIVKVKKIDLENLIKSNNEAHRILDMISTQASEVAEELGNAISKLENAESDIESYIVEDEEKE